MTEEKAPPPNILWICSDQQRFDTLGCYDNAFVHTPHIDKLAAEGTLFSRAYCQSPICTPSRASFLTGRYPRTTRCRQNGQDIPDDEVLVTRVLADAGYRCGLAGKLHLSPCNPSVCTDGERRIDDGYTDFHWAHHAEPSWEASEYGQWLKARGVAFEHRPHPETKHVVFGPDAPDHQTTWCAEKAVEFIDARAADGLPWLFSVNMFDPHHAFDPPEDLLARYAERLDEIPLPAYEPGELDNKPPWQRYDHDGAYGHTVGFAWQEMSEHDHRLVRAAYWAMCDLIDDRVGRMLDALDRTGQRENTIVIYMSDHGELLGDHGIYLKGPFFYEPAVRVPLVVHWPKRIAARESPALVELNDLPQTLLDAAGVAHHPGMQGRSLWPLLTGDADAGRHRDDVYCEYYNSMQWQDPPAHATMVRTERHKIVVAHGLETGELYDLTDDPSETVNLWDDPARAGLRSEMLQRVCDRLAWTVDPLPVRRAPW